MSEEISKTPDISLSKKSKLEYAGLVLNVLLILLVTYSYLAFFSKVLSVFLTFIIGLILIVLLLIFAIISLGTIFLTSFGEGLVNIVGAVWKGEAIQDITSLLYLSLPYTLIIGIVVNILCITCSIFTKRKKGLILNIVCLVLLIILLILRLCIGVV